MSRFSSSFDLLDHISGLGGLYNDKGEKLVFNNDSKSYEPYYYGPQYSDLYQDFLEFKKRTNGILYQHKHIKEIRLGNEKFIEEHCPAFKIITHVENIVDNRFKDGYRVNEYHTYNYYGKEYSAQELKKKGGVYITVEIHFATLLDLIPYLPYGVSACSCVDGHETVFITNQSIPEEEFEDGIQYGFEHGRDYYRKELAKLYQEVVLRYFNPAGREVTETLTVIKGEYDKEGNFGLDVYPIYKVDTDFPVQVVRDRWDYILKSPVATEDSISVTNVWPDLKPGDKITLKYVKKGEHKLWLK